ncbi:FOG precursor [Clonorchis sinensis]|uniref:FOG n=1 Tax=Clonorchis sinensis TaxID=79923 RepID=G7Y4R4_CLOSI|nr:FOG precursor [Clonorchis sinensis]
MKDTGCASKHIREFQGSQPGLIGLRERGPTKGAQNPWEFIRKREEARLAALDDLARLEAEQKRIKWEEETRRRMIDDETLRRFKQIKQQQVVEQAKKWKLADELQQESRRKEEQEKTMREMNLKEERMELEKIKQQLEEERIAGLREKFFRQCKIDRNLKECMEERQAAQFLERLREESLAKGILISRDDTDESRALDKERMKKETLQYLDYVRQAKISEKLFENKVEQAAQHALKREAQRVAAKKAQEEAARRRLAWETAYVRQQQTQLKEQQRELGKLMKKHEAEEMKTLNDAVQKELSEQITRKRSRIEAYKKELEHQIADHEIRKAAELAEVERQIEAQNRAEQVLQERINQAIHARTLDPHRHPWRKMSYHEKPDAATKETADQTLCGCVFS